MLILGLQSSLAQSTAEKKLGAWYIYDGTHKVANKWGFKTGVQIRSFEVADNINLLLLHLGANYDLNKKVTLTIGYCYLDIDRSIDFSGENHLYENRPYEQISYNQEIFKFPINQRLRLEHRFLNFKNNHSILHRFRYRIGTKIKLNKTLFININEEIFANLKNQVFTENRFYAAFGYNISKSSNIQLGYMNHEINKQNLNRLQLGLYIKTDHRKKK